MATELYKSKSEIGSSNNYHAGGMIFSNVPPPTKIFCGREDELQRISKIWEEWNNNNKDLLFVTITGPGGIGKSELAANYAASFHKEQGGDSIWINAENPGTILDSLRTLATELGMTLKDPEEKEKRLKDILPEIFKKLISEKCLLILDNLNNFDSEIVQQLTSRQFLRRFNPFLLVTTNINNIPKSLPVEVVQLDILKRHDAELFLKEALNIKNECDDIKTATEMGKLVQELDGHPLTLHQAASYFKNKLRNSSLEVEIRKYLLDFQGRKSQLTLSSNTFSGNLTCGNTIIYSAIQISFENIRVPFGTVNEEDASTVMKIIAFLSPDNIPLTLLRRILEFFKNSNEAEIQDEDDSIFRLLSANSLCTLKEDGEFPSVSVHRLVQEAVLLHLEKSGEMEEILDSLVESFEKLISLNQLPSTQIIFVQSLWEHISLEKFRVEKHDSFADTVYYQHHKSGWNQQAYDFSSKASQVLKKFLGNKNKWTLKMIHWKAHHMANYGDIQEALRLLMTVYNTQRLEFGVQNTECLLTARKIGIVHKKLWDFRKAYHWFHYVELQEKAFQKDDSVFLYLQIDIAKCCIAFGDYEDAFSRLSKVLELQLKENVTYFARSALGDLYFSKGEFKLALQEYSAVLQKHEDTLGDKDHPLILKTKFLVAKTLKSLGSRRESLDIANQLLNQQTRIYGDHDDRTLKVQKLIDQIRRI